MELAIGILIYMMIILLPIHVALVYRIIYERKQMKRILLGIWRIYPSRKLH